MLHRQLDLPDVLLTNLFIYAQFRRVRYLESILLRYNFRTISFKEKIFRAVYLKKVGQMSGQPCICAFDLIVFLSVVIS